MTEQEKIEAAAAKEAAANEEYLKITNNNSSLDNLVKTAEDYKQGIRKEVWPTGFIYLDDALDGGLYGSQLVCVGAISSLGKTSFILQIATQIAEQGKDVLIFSLEMSRDELNAKTVSRYSYINAMDKEPPKNVITKFTTRDILKGEIGEEQESQDAFAQAVEKARLSAPHTYVYVGNNDVSVDDVRDTVKRHCAATGRRPVVILDYLQILSPTKSAVAKHYDARRSTNDDITNLKVLAREYDIPVIVISAFNRASYTDPVSMSSFRESSGIEYSADILIGIQYKGMDYDDDSFFTNPNTGAHQKGRESEADHYTRVMKLFAEVQQNAADGKSQNIEVKLLKNRNGSRQTVRFQFTPKYNYFTDALDAEELGFPMYYSKETRLTTNVTRKKR